MSDIPTNRQEPPAASSSNAVAYPKIPTVESDSESDENADGSAIGNLVGNQVGKPVEQPVEDAVGKPVEKAVEEKDDEKDDDTDEEDLVSPKMTPTEKFKIVEAILKAKEKNKDIQAAIEKALPPDVSFNFRQIQAAIHSDRFAGDEAKEKKAKEAFQILGSLRDKMETGSRKVDKNNAFYFGNDPSRPQAHAEGELSSYHDAAHKKATRHLKIIYEAVKLNPSPKPDDPPSEKMEDSIYKLDELNKGIREDNKKNNKETYLGIVRYQDFLGKWRPLFTANRETKKELRKLLLQYCKQMHYPTTWASEPPHYKRADKANEGASDQGVASQGAAKPGAANPGSIQEGFNNSGTSIFHTMTPQKGNTVFRTKQVIRTTPQTVERAIKKGFTTSGEEILYIQPLGRGARFVVKNDAGDVRLISSSSAGGKIALDGAEELNVPSTTQDPAEILALRALVRLGGEYGLEFVAIGEWDTSRKKLPFIVVLFFIKNSNTTIRHAISRSALMRILATREAENLIVQSITGETEMSLVEALASQLPPEVSEKIHTGRNGPLLLPYGEAPQPWWFQNNQQPGPQAAFHGNPAQQQYLSFPQGLGPQFTQHSPPGQFQYNSPQFVPQFMPQFGKASPQDYKASHQPQAGLFPPQDYQSFSQPQAGLSSIQAWPIFDPLTKHGARSPVPSLMELDMKA